MKRLEDLDDLIPEPDPVQEESLPDDPLEWARWYVSCGISVIPIRPDGTKAPALSSWSPYRERIATDAELKQWFDGAGMFAAGIGIVTGSISGDLVMFEAETDEGLYALESAMEDHGLTHIWHKLELRVRSGGGGTHIYYRCPGACGSNTKLAQKSKADGGKPIIETRSEGGYAVAPGSGQATHNKGRYMLESGTFESIPILSPEEQDALFCVARTLDERVEEHQPATRTMPSPDRNGELRPGDDFVSRCTVEQLCELLEKHGWHSRRHTPRSCYLTRPGKAARDGSSGAVLEPNARSPVAMFYCHTTSTDFEAGAYNPFAVFAMLEHGGDFAEAASALRSMGYGEALSPLKPLKPSDVVGASSGTLSPLKPLKPLGMDSRGGNRLSSRYYSRETHLYSTNGFNGDNGENAVFEPSDPWDGDFVTVADEAPCSWPEAPASIANALRTELFAATVGVPLEMFAPLQIATIAACAQGRVAVAHPNRHREALCVWVAAIAAPGSRKSGAVNTLSRPLHEIERELLDESKPKRNEWESKARKLRKALTEAEHRKPSGSPIEDSEEERIAAREVLEMHEAEVPKSPAFLLQDFTPEALDQAMHEGESRVAVFDPEATLFVAFANPRHGKASNDANLCKYFSSEPVRVNRKGGADGIRTSYHIESGVVTLCLASQPSKVKEVLENEHLMGSGFALRFLFSKVPYFRPQRNTPDPSQIEAWWARLLRDLWEGLPPGGKISEIPVLRLGPDAEAAYDEYTESVEASREVSGESMQSWMGKAVGYCLRLAANLHLAVHRAKGLDIPISGETMRYAVELMGYFEAHARLLIERSADRTLSDVIRFAEVLGKPRKRNLIAGIRDADGIVSFSDLTRELRPMSRDRIEEGILAFEEIGWARAMKRQNAKGRAGRSWQIRREAFDEMMRIAERSREGTA